jgi:hypothetical protein
MFRAFAVMISIAVLGLFLTGHIRMSDLNFGGQNLLYLLVLPWAFVMLLVQRMNRD